MKNAPPPLHNGRRIYCCDSSCRLYENYYAGQGGGEDIPIFRGHRFRQRGHGLGAILGSLLRRFVLPLGPTLAKRALQTVTSIGRDVIGGRPLGGATKKHAISGIKQLGEDVVSQSIAGLLGKRSSPTETTLSAKKVKKSTKKKKKKNNNKSQKKSTHRDVFG